MRSYLEFLNETANRVSEEHAHHSVPVNWVNPYLASEFEEIRNSHAEKIGEKQNWFFKHTKPWVNSLSPGCRLCGEGEWSCLFITGICNAHCFYCPASQEKDEIPQTQKLLFDDPVAYAHYINRFGFKGVSFSGGEPLMVFDRTLTFIRTVRELCLPDIYIWVYTNGILGSEEKFRQLAEAGINEIRFDLGATNYNTKVLRGASRFIQNVTVEIPAVPEEVPLLKKILPELCGLGVTNLNLHQLRLTKHNAENLLQHEYTYLHAEQPTVLESELAAFELMAFVTEQGLPIGVNYCNFQFKNRFQKAGFRKKMALQLVKPGEEITENGFLRTIVADNSEMSFETLVLHTELPQQIVLYYRGRVLENLNPSKDGNQYEINGVSYPVLDGLSVEPVLLRGTQVSEYIEMMNEKGKIIPPDPQVFKAWQQEFIEEGMREYF